VRSFASSLEKQITQADHKQVLVSSVRLRGSQGTACGPAAHTAGITGSTCSRPHGAALLSSRIQGGPRTHCGHEVHNSTGFDSLGSLHLSIHPLSIHLSIYLSIYLHTDTLHCIDPALYAPPTAPLHRLAPTQEPCPPPRCTARPAATWGGRPMEIETRRFQMQNKSFADRRVTGDPPCSSPRRRAASTQIFSVHQQS
jgi:hypothetical protein